MGNSQERFVQQPLASILVLVLLYEDGAAPSNSSGYFRYSTNSNAPNTAVLIPVAIVRDSGSPSPKLKNAMLRT